MRYSAGSPAPAGSLALTLSALFVTKPPSTLAQHRRTEACLLPLLERSPLRWEALLLETFTESLHNVVERRRREGALMSLRLQRRFLVRDPSRRMQRACVCLRAPISVNRNTHLAAQRTCTCIRKRIRPHVLWGSFCPRRLHGSSPARITPSCGLGFRVLGLLHATG